LFGALDGHTEQMMVDVHITEWRYRGNQGIKKFVGVS